LAVVELALGAWLFSGIRPDLSRRSAAICFFIFTGWSLWEIAQGVESCGCFGGLKTNPRFSFCLDVSVLLLLLISRHGTGSVCSRRELAAGVRKPKWRAVGLLLGATALFVAASFVAAHRTAPKAKAISSLIRPGYPWPENVVKVAADPTQGNWLVLIYDSSCHRCRAIAEEYAELARAWKAEGRQNQIALIDAAADPDWEKIGNGTDTIEGLLLDPREYRSIPLFALVRNGRVEYVEESWRIPYWKRPPYAGWLDESPPGK
jgi:hypothetical protein